MYRFSFYLITGIAVFGSACSSPDPSNTADIPPVKTEYTVTQTTDLPGSGPDSTTGMKASKELKSADTLGLEARIISSGTGFGYEIYQHGRLMIVQEHIPAVQGRHYFQTKEKAEKAAALVIKKIRGGEMPPSVTEEELRNSGAL